EGNKSCNGVSRKRDDRNAATIISSPHRKSLMRPWLMFYSPKPRLCGVIDQYFAHDVIDSDGDATGGDDEIVIRPHVLKEFAQLLRAIVTVHDCGLGRTPRAYERCDHGAIGIRDFARR